MELFSLGANTKQMAHALEISVSTVNFHIARICRLAGVSRSELVIYVLQYPEALKREGRPGVGLHSPNCPCPAPYCMGMRKEA